MSYEELETILYEIEYVINCRPLVYLSDDDIHDALTPFHLLYGRNLLTYKVNNDYHIKNEQTSHVSKRFRKLQTDLNNYWTCFSKSYLNELRQHHIYRSAKANSNRRCNLQNGDVVVIKEDFKVPRNEWKLGKVTELIKGTDGNTRGAKLLTMSKSGFRTSCYRPIQKLIPFEITKDSKVSLSDDREKVHCANERPARRAASEGEQLRKLRDMCF